MFEQVIVEPDSETHRTCGVCLERKPFTDYYRDGLNRDGSIKYRRDCRDCYRKTRLMERQAKRPRRK